MIIDMLERSGKLKLLAKEPKFNGAPLSTSEPILHEVYINKYKHLKLIGRRSHYVTYCFECELGDLDYIDYRACITNTDCYRELREWSDSFLAFEYGYAKIVSSTAAYYLDYECSFPTSSSIRSKYHENLKRAIFLSSHLNWKMVNEALDEIDEEMCGKMPGQDSYSYALNKKLDQLTQMECMLLSPNPYVVSTYERYLRHRSDQFQFTMALR